MEEIEITDVYGMTNSYNVEFYIGTREYLFVYYKKTGNVFAYGYEYDNDGGYSEQHMPSVFVDEVRTACMAAIAAEILVDWKLRLL